MIAIRNNVRPRAIVFVHGWMGDALLTWQPLFGILENNESLSDWDIYSFGYKSTVWSMPTYQTLALSLYTAICKSNLAEYESLAIVAYAEGGLIAQLALLSHEDLLTRVHQVFFFATPNAGLRLLSVDVFGPLHLLLRISRFLSLFSSLLNNLFESLLEPLLEIRPGSPFLRVLGERWRQRFGDHAPFDYWAIAGDRDVSVSVDSLLTFSEEHRLVATGDHFSIIRPDSVDSPTVQILLSALRNQPLPDDPRRAAQGTITLAVKQELREFDVFLYSASRDGDEVRQISEQLKQSGIRPWLTEDHVIPGRSWTSALFQDIDRIRSVAVSIGKGGSAPWQKTEPANVIAEFSKRGLPVIPVQLQSSPENSEWPDTLSGREPVDFRDQGSAPLDRLIAGIQGHAPAKSAAPKVPSMKAVPRHADSNDGPGLWYKRPGIKWPAIALTVIFSIALTGWRVYEHWMACGKFADAPIIHHAGRDTAHYVRDNKSDRVIVFVHGIFGNAEGTWTSPPDLYWPELIASDELFGKPDIYVAAYDTGVGNSMTMDEVAQGLYQRFTDAGVFTKHRQVIFICHSLGGLVTERFLLKHRELAPQVPLIYFYGTPQTGAQIARVGSVFSDDPLLREMAPGSSNDYLQTMESDWRNAGFSTIRRLCAYEKLKYKCVLVVDSLSGSRGCDDATAVNKNHVTLVKPNSTQDSAYILFRNAWSTLTVVDSKWGWIDPVSPPDFAAPLGKLLTSADSPLSAVEWARLNVQRKEQTPAQWIVFGSPEYNATTVPDKITLAVPEAATMVLYAMESNGNDWHEIEKTDLGTSIHCQTCVGRRGKLRFIVLVFPLDRSAYDQILNSKNDSERLFLTDATVTRR